MNKSPAEWSWRLEKSIPSSSDEGHKVIESLMQAIEASGWEGRDYFHVHMATEEAIVNAIEHGNKRSDTKRVQVDFRVSPELVWLQVSDEGDGFDPESLPDPTDDELLERPRGRGVMLIRELMSETHYNDRGNSVTMIKHRSKTEES